MRWERLFADLEARFEAEERATADGDLIDLVRAERGRLTFRDRLQAHSGESLTWSLGFGEITEEGELLDLGADWVLVRTVRGEVLIPSAAVQYVSGLSRAASPVTGEVARRLGLAVVLRGLSRDRAVVSVRLRGDHRMTGTIDRVGADHLDLAVHPADQPRRSAAVLGVRCLLFHAIVGVSLVA
jgi:hypothetical protein